VAEVNLLVKTGNYRSHLHFVEVEDEEDEDLSVWMPPTVH
jgi:hypothetical protein